jgi:murein L,D-transpeptidase YcbB/YkuD
LARVPRSIVEHEVIPELRKDPRYLRRARLVVLDRRGRRVNLRHIRRSSVATLTFRQEPGGKNALGRLRVNMLSPYDVYMHDTPEQRLFSDSYRFLSHGCLRVDGIYDPAA